MKRALWLVMFATFAVLLFPLATGCSSTEVTLLSEPPATSSTDFQTTSSPQSTDSATPATDATEPAASMPVFAPHDLLTAEEAAEMSGFAVTLDSGSLYEDPATGTISERYVYDLGSSTIHALVEIHQDSLKSSEDLEAGDTVLGAFTFEQDLSKNEITPVDLGEQAFTFDNNGQLHIYYQNYYVVVAFDADEYDSSKNAPLNILLGHRILANLREALH